MNITRNSARSACAALGPKYALISNAQWQTIARNIEQVASNWSGGAVGVGAVNRGHSSGSSVLAADEDDTNACVGTGATCSDTIWHDKRRTNYLSNGEVIWDLGGNAAEWVYDDYSSLGLQTSGITLCPRELNTLSAANRPILGPSDPTWYSAHGLGQACDGNAGAVLRGGAVGSGQKVGIFSSDLTRGTGLMSSGFSFRCVWNP